MRKRRHRKTSYFAQGLSCCRPGHAVKSGIWVKGQLCTPRPHHTSDQLQGDWAENGNIKQQHIQRKTELYRCNIFENWPFSKLWSNRRKIKEKQETQLQKHPHAPVRSEWTGAFLCVQQLLIHPVCWCQDCHHCASLPVGQDDHDSGCQPGLRGGCWRHSSRGRGSTFHLALWAIEVMEAGGYQKPPPVGEADEWLQSTHGESRAEDTTWCVDRNTSKPDQPRAFQS